MHERHLGVPEAVGAFFGNDDACCECLVECHKNPVCFLASAARRWQTICGRPPNGWTSIFEAPWAASMTIVFEDSP